jgi:hypothetical protein
MALHFLFRANAITFSLPPNDNFVGNASTLQIISGPVADAVSDARNNVRFLVAASAGQGDFESVLFTLQTVHTFRFQPREQGRLTTSTFFQPSGSFSMAAREKEWWDAIDPTGGQAVVGVSARMDTRVVAQNGAVVLPRTSSETISILGESIQAVSTPVADEGVLATQLMDFVRTQSFALLVTPTDRVRVRAIYTVQAIVTDRATFALDFSVAGSDGLNVPMAVMRTD